MLEYQTDRVGTKMLKELFFKQKELIDSFFDSLDHDQVQKLFEMILNSDGTVIFTGIGKSGIVAKKIAMTLLSTGTKAMYLSAMNARHGDIGMVHPKDIFVLFSKSGESDELLNLVPCIRNKQAKVVGVTCCAESRLARSSDLHIELPLKQELCPFDLAPTTSAAIQLIFGDVLATALMKEKQFSLDEYALNHPSGRIGRRITVTVGDLMCKGEALPLCSRSNTLGEILSELSLKRCGCVLVVNQNQELEGIFTDGDLRRALQENSLDVKSAKIEDVMTLDPKWIESDALAWDALKKMEEDQKHPVTVLPVISQKKVVGLIKLHDIIQAGI